MGLFIFMRSLGRKGIVIVPKGIVLLVGNNFDSDIAHLGWERVVKWLRHLQEIYKIQYIFGAQRATGGRLSWVSIQLFPFVEVGVFVMLEIGYTITGIEPNGWSHHKIISIRANYTVRPFIYAHSTVHCFGLVVISVPLGFMWFIHSCPPGLPPSQTLG